MVTRDLLIEPSFLTRQVIVRSRHGCQILFTHFTQVMFLTDIRCDRM